MIKTHHKTYLIKAISALPLKLHHMFMTLIDSTEGRQKQFC